jgi:Fe-S cluster biogenesis protein NfuA
LLGETARMGGVSSRPSGLRSYLTSPSPQAEKKAYFRRSKRTKQPSTMTDQEKKLLLQQVDQALDDVRPHLAADGGNVEVVDITDELTVQVRWLGNCETCFMSVMTMKAGIEQAIKNKIPSIRQVEAVNGVA